MADFMQFVLTGVTVGLVYSLIALGFTFIWKSSSVANLALGQMVLLFSWIAYGTLHQAGMPFWIGLPVTILAAVGVGWILERVILRPLIGQPILSLITVTLGIAFIFEGIVSILWPISTAAMPAFIPDTPVQIFGAVVSQEYLWAAGIALVLFILVSVFFRYHKMGVAMRATADDQMAVWACGIPVTRIFSVSWMFAGALAAIGGVLMSSIGGITTGLVETGLKSFSVVILGGLDSFLGAMVAGPIIGLAENLGGGYLTQYIWPGIKDVIPFIIIIIVLFIKPYGLFGQVRIERI
jgi:branched-chain amino acid transport system permease protein